MKNKSEKTRTILQGWNVLTDITHIASGVRLEFKPDIIDSGNMPTKFIFQIVGIEIGAKVDEIKAHINDYILEIERKENTFLFWGECGEELFYLRGEAAYNLVPYDADDLVEVIAWKDKLYIKEAEDVRTLRRRIERTETFLEKSIDRTQCILKQRGRDPIKFVERLNILKKVKEVLNEE